MPPLRATVLLSLLAACASPGNERTNGEEGTLLPPPDRALPRGSLVRTSRPSDFAGMLEEVARADLVIFGRNRGAAPPVRVAALLVEHLHARGRLHAVALQEFRRDEQPALDDFAFARIDEAALRERLGAARIDANRPLLVLARRLRLPVLGLGVEAELRARIAAEGVGSLSAAQRASLPAIPDAADLDREVMADVLHRWFGIAPEQAQVLVLVDVALVEERLLLPERVRQRTGRTFATIVALPEPEGARDRRHLAEEYADFVWFLEGA